MKNKSVAIVVPIHKNQLNELEKISIDRLVNVFDNYDIFFAVPESTRLRLPEGIYIEKFESKFFESLNTYSKLMLSKNFYERFLQYTYILIYQPDAFVFSNNLEYFCKLDYDYIGAPWLWGEYKFLDTDHTAWYVGNGGLSLRKTEKFLKMIDDQKELIERNIDAEDVFLATMANEDFRIAPIDIALQFSFETRVRECFKRNENKLPFGCHAWEKYDLEFWKPYIEAYGYTIPPRYIRCGQKDFSEEFIKGLERTKERIYYWENQFNKNDFKNNFKNLYSSKSDVYIIWGAGYWGNLVYRLLSSVGFKIKYIIDNNKGLSREKLDGNSIITFNEYKQLSRQENMVIAIWEKDSEIEQQLKNIGYKYKMDYIWVKDLKEVIEYL
ncbi:MAG: hypothetical protein IKY94_03335 [Lachnospiraceae bacterium]|nr:hypothetical protein [Lachnospiraceae bacterium]